MDYDPTDATDGGRPRTHLFSLRLWRVDTPTGAEYRGSVRDVVNGAWRHFRDWSDAQSFIVERVEECERERELIANEDGGMS
ncbi:MAG TPA: hypothetical protein VMM78_17030 [Thermomicrobiales bacterium]|nr:hypothetical protein [Thermomicrobiales bacterium]